LTTSAGLVKLIVFLHGRKPLTRREAGAGQGAFSPALRVPHGSGEIVSLSTVGGAFRPKVSNPKVTGRWPLQGDRRDPTLQRHPLRQIEIRKAAVRAALPARSPRTTRHLHSARSVGAGSQNAAVRPSSCRTSMACTMHAALCNEASLSATGPVPSAIRLSARTAHASPSGQAQVSATLMAPSADRLAAAASPSNRCTSAR